MAGMGGGAILPEPIGFTELDAWARLTASHPSPWELGTLLAMDDAWRSAHAGKAEGTAQHQGLGDYCRSERIEECRATLGPALEQACRTCPN